MNFSSARKMFCSMESDSAASIALNESGRDTDEFSYHLKTRIQRSDTTGGNEVPYRQIAQQVKPSRERSDWRWKTGWL
jgi:hypothetical protein